MLKGWKILEILFHIFLQLYYILDRWIENVKHQLMKISGRQTLCFYSWLPAIDGMNWKFQKVFRCTNTVCARALSCHATGIYEANFHDKLSLSYITHFLQFYGQFLQSVTRLSTCHIPFWIFQYICFNIIQRLYSACPNFHVFGCPLQ